MNSLINNQVTCGILILMYCTVYGICATRFLSGVPMMFLLCSMVFAMTVFYIKDPDPKKEKKISRVFVNPAVGTILVIYYVSVFGPTSVCILKGIELLFFMSSFIFALSIFYSLDDERKRNSLNDYLDIASMLERILKFFTTGTIAKATIGIVEVSETKDGLLITKLEPDGPAKRAGLRGPKILVDKEDSLEHRSIDNSFSDLIVSVDGKLVGSFKNFLKYIEGKSPGSKVKMTVMRDSEEVIIAVALGKHVMKYRR